MARVKISVLEKDSVELEYPEESSDSDVAVLGGLYSSGELLLEDENGASSLKKLNLRWSVLVSEWQESPVLQSSLAGGKVLKYVHKGVTYFRLVPSPYVPSEDSFYEDFDGTLLTNKVCSRA